MVCVRDLVPFSEGHWETSEEAPLSVPVVIASFESSSDRLPETAERSLDYDLQDRNLQERSVDHLSPFLQPDIPRTKVQTFPQHLRFAEYSPVFSPQFDLNGNLQECTGVDPFEELFDYSDFSSSLSESSPPPHEAMVHSFQDLIQGMGTEHDKAKITRLIRQDLSVRGMKMLDIRYKLHGWFQEWERTHGAVPVEVQKKFALFLIESEWYEDKLAAILFIQEVLIAKKHISHTDLTRFETVFRKGHIKVYKVCDHFATKILHYLVEQGSSDPCEKALILERLFVWTGAADLWQARAALFALATQAKNGICQKKLISSIRHMLLRPEEEAKSMAGAALRSISEIDPHVVVEFLNTDDHIANFSASALSKATSKLTKIQRDAFKNIRRELCSARPA